MSVHASSGVVVVMDPDPVVYAKVFYSGSEPDRFLRKKARNVALTARVLAPRRTGRLASSIRVDQNRDERGHYAFGFSVYTRTPYAGYVHEGTGPHVYFSYPKKMRFKGTNAWAGQTIFTDMIDHPGTPAQPFLQKALIELAR